MNNEQYNQIIDEAYENYTDTVYSDGITYIDDVEEYDEVTLDNGDDWPIVVPFSKEKFINKCKTDIKFAKQWGLEIEERKLTFEERWDLSKKYGYRTGDAEIPSPDSIYLGLNERQEIESLWNDPVIGTNLPTKLTTITYKDKTIEVYE